MTREQKYPDTRTFHYFNANPKNRKGSDCVVRAVCTALEQSWEDTVREMTEVGLKHGFLLNDDKTIDKYMEYKGWVKCRQPRKADNTKYTGKEWCRRLQAMEIPTCQRMSKIVANLGGHHTVAIMDGKVYDIWDSTDGCIGNYWIKR